MQENHRSSLHDFHSWNHLLYLCLSFLSSPFLHENIPSKPPTVLKFDSLLGAERATWWEHASRLSVFLSHPLDAVFEILPALPDVLRSFSNNSICQSKFRQHSQEYVHRWHVLLLNVLNDTGIQKRHNGVLLFVQIQRSLSFCRSLHLRYRIPRPHSFSMKYSLTVNLHWQC